MGYVLGRKPEHEIPCKFLCKVAAGGDERYLVCVRRLRLRSVCLFFAAVERWLQAVVAVPACVCVVIGCEVWDVKSAVRSVKCGV